MRQELLTDAFLDSFLMVTPTGKQLSEQTGAWVDAESKRALKEWRKQFRGEAHCLAAHVAFVLLEQVHHRQQRRALVLVLRDDPFALGL